MKTKLIKAINEMYFRNFQDTDMLQIKQENFFTETLFKNCEVTYVLDKDSETYKMCLDLLNLELGNVEIPVESILAKECLNEARKLEESFIKNFQPSWNTVKVMTILDELSKESYFVGGCVRDGCRGIVPKDVDFCTDTPMETLVQEFTKAGFKCDEVGLQFLVLVVSRDSNLGIREEFEIANFRKDRDNSGGEAGTMAEDAKRRDFGCNTGYMRIHDGKLFDPNEMFVDDINSMTLRFVGKATDRLEEDYIRGYRFMRFLGRGFNAEKKSLQAVRQHWGKIHTECNPERVRLEIEKMAGL